MKSCYKISEISALYNICPDSLRYYEEKGVLSPRRDVNGYRLYGLRDIWRLNVIKELRQLDFSLERIKEYLDNRTVATTLALLAEEDRLIGEKIAALEGQRQGIARRAAEIGRMSARPADEMGIVSLPARHCCRIQENVSLDGEVDFLIKRLQKAHEGSLYIIGNSRIGAMIDQAGLAEGVYNRYSAVFIITDEAAIADSALPAGEYASVCYRGGYGQTADYLPRLAGYVRERGYRIVGAPLELYGIDIHETSRQEEFVTEIQLPVSRAAQ